jgi:hypothetical protein
MYGKFAGFGDFIFNYDAFISGGLGLIRTEPIAVIDPNNRKFDSWNNFLNFDAAIGFRIFFTRWLAAVLEVRDLIFFDTIESLSIAGGPSTLPLTNKQNPLDPDTWTDSGHFTNDVQLQIGISLFLPTSFEYRLPK